MRLRPRSSVALAFAILSAPLSALGPIPLYDGPAKGSESWTWEEKRFVTKAWEQEIVTNGAKPSLTVFKPAAGTANGTAIVVAPGEGGAEESNVDMQGDRAAFAKKFMPIIPLAVAAPTFIATASNDGLDLQQNSVTLYSKWLAAKKPVEPHRYARGNHGFGMRKQGIPTDTWIERFSEWLALNGFLKTRATAPPAPAAPPCAPTRGPHGLEAAHLRRTGGFSIGVAVVEIAERALEMRAPVRLLRATQDALDAVGHEADRQPVCLLLALGRQRSVRVLPGGGRMVMY